MRVLLEYSTIVWYFDDDQIANGEVELNGRRELVEFEVSLVMFPGQVRDARRGLANIGEDWSEYDLSLEFLVLPFECTGL